MSAMLLAILLAPPPVGPLPPDPFDRPDEITVVAVVHPFTAAVWTKAGELLAVSPEKDEPGSAGLLRRYGPDLTLAATVKVPATARQLVLDEAGGRLFAVTGSPTDDAPSAGLLVAYKLADLTGEAARPVATLRTPLRVSGIALSPDGKALYVAVGTALLTVDAATLKQTGSVKGQAERAAVGGQRVYVAAGEVVRVFDGDLKPVGIAKLSGPVVGLTVMSDGAAAAVTGGDAPKLWAVATDAAGVDLTPATGLGAAGHLAVAGRRLVLTASERSGIEVFQPGWEPTPALYFRADKPPHEFRGPVALSPDGKRAACGCGTVAGLPK